MRMIKIVIAAFVVVTAFGIAAIAAQPEKIPILKSYDVAYVSLDTPVTVTENGKKASYDKAYLVRLHGDFPTGGASVMRIYFGAEAVREYGGLPDGIYFLIYKPERLKEYAGKEIRYRIDDGPINSFDVRFDPRGFEPLSLTKFKDAVTR